MDKKKFKIIIVVAIAVVVAGLVVLGAFRIADIVAKKKKDEENARIIREYYESKIAAYTAENASDPEQEIIFLGDSLTDGCDIPKYYGEYKASNRGIGGERSYGLLDRMRVSAYDAKPKVIVLLIGGNDILAGKSIESVCENCEKIVTGIHDNLPDTKIVWCSLTALGNEWAKYNDTMVVCNQKIKLLAKKYGCAFVDLFTPLCNEETGGIFAEYTVEGVHLTDAGYQVVSTEIKKPLREFLGH